MIHLAPVVEMTDEQFYRFCGWLIDPTKREVHVYRQNASPVRLQGVESVSGDPVLSGFVLDLRTVWTTDI